MRDSFNATRHFGAARPSMKTLLAPAALLADGWQTDVAIVIDDDGRSSASSARRRRADAERLAGPVIPAMPNLHSHAFQRAIAGRTGLPSPHRDDTFWTWRQAMYAAVDRLDADAFEAIAAQAYVEMAKAGYASVAEFHYVHHDPHGKPYADPAELAWRIVERRPHRGHRAHAAARLLCARQFRRRRRRRRGSGASCTASYTFEKLFDALDAQGASRAATSLGVAPHSLRAVTPEELDEGRARWRRRARRSTSTPPSRRAKSTTAMRGAGMRPIEWLLDARGRRRALVRRACDAHDRARSRGPRRERRGRRPRADHRGRPWRRHLPRRGLPAGGRPIRHRHRLEHADRSVRRSAAARVVAAIARCAGATCSSIESQTPVGQRAVARGRAGRRAGAGAADRRDRGRHARRPRSCSIADDPALAEQPIEHVLDAAIFGPCRRPVRDVMSGGRWIVREGRHAREQDVYRRFRAALARFDSSATTP